MTSYRNRKVKQFWIEAGDLVPNPLNPRTHPSYQRDALTASLERLGDADILKVVKMPDGRYMLLDGHLRADVMDGAQVEVVELDLNESEQAEFLALFDQIGAMALIDQDIYGSIAETVASGDDRVIMVLEAVMNDNWQSLRPLIDPTIPENEWTGMPEFESDDINSWHKVVIHFRDDNDLKDFAKLIGQPINNKTRFAWYPFAERHSYITKRYAADDA